MRPRHLAEPGRFYFALPRLVAKARGQSGARATRSAAEANGTSVAIFTISLLFAATFIQPGQSTGRMVILCVSLPFAVVVFWLAALYFQSLVIRLGRSAGLLHGMPNDRAQSVLICAETTAFALALVMSGNWPARIGALWVIAVGLNLAADVMLSLNDEAGPA